ncbi:Protein translocase subunit SecD [Serratia symbiotica]|nr:Protein translocase subunit SecD [Serratia symbiotica]
MINYYPLCKYTILIIIIFTGLLYAIPNFYGEDPALKINSKYDTNIDKVTLNKIKVILKKHNIFSKILILKNNTIFIHFTNSITQFNAHEILTKALNNKFIITMYLSPITPNWLTMIGAKPIKLGLDLRGGIHFLIEVNMYSVLEKLKQETIETLHEELNKNNISYEYIKKLNKNNIEIHFHNVINQNKAINYIKTNKHNFTFSIINHNSLQINILTSTINKANEYAIQKNINILRYRVNKLGISESLVQRYGINYIIVELPGIQDTTHAKEILGSTATLEFHLVKTILDDIKIFNSKKINNYKFKYIYNNFPIILYKSVILTGDHIINSISNINEYNQPEVNITLDNTGSNLISNFTENNIGKLIATVFIEYKNSGKKDINGHTILIKKEKIINIANIQSSLGKNFRITGIQNKNEANHLAMLLRSGTLITPIHIIEERIIGPTLGKQNIIKGIKTCVYGLIISIIFMISWYRKFSIISIIGLLINLILIIGIMSILPGATLTMPGIAGIMLIIAVIIDSNILINERIKEELKNKHSIQYSIHNGYKKAFSSIFDANITTLITSIILYIIGTNSIKGFAITMSIGIITSLFTTIFITHSIINLLYNNKYIKTLSI